MNTRRRYPMLSKILSGVGRQLVIVDVQKAFEKHSKHLVQEIVDYAKGFDDIVYIYDTMFLDQEPRADHNMFKAFKDSHLNVKSVKITKEYGFLRELMDHSNGYTDDEIIPFLKWCIDNDVDLPVDRETLPEQFARFGESDYGLDFGLPSDLIEEFRSKVRTRPILVGGARNECLREVYLLMAALGLKPEIKDEYVYGSVAPVTSSLRAFAKATLPEGSEILDFYFSADAEGWRDEQKEGLEEDWNSLSDEDKKDVPAQLRYEGYPAEYYSDDKGNLNWDDVKEYWISMRLRDLQDDADTTETFFENARLLSNPTLVRFTSYVTPEEAMKPGFQFLGHSPRNLGLTAGPFSKRPGDGDLAFAVEKRDLKSQKDWDHFRSKYGEYAYEFKVPYAVKAYHNTDGEDQVVFDVTTVKNLKSVGFDTPRIKKPGRSPLEVRGPRPKLKKKSGSA